MWTGLYLIVFTLFFFGFISGGFRHNWKLEQSEMGLEDLFYLFCATIGFYGFFLITIAYGINLIINN